jgi:TolB-like protein
MTYSSYSSSRTLYLIPVVVCLLSFVSGCALSQLPHKKESCKIQAYVDQTFVDYLDARFQKGNVPRLAIVPFDTQENFSPPMNPHLRFGNRLAQGFQQQFLARNEAIIVEVFLRDWPGKRLDFTAGNFQAINYARDAGYDFVVVGFVEDIVNDLKIRVHTKIIDVDNGMTVWYGTTDVKSNARSSRGFLRAATRGSYPERDDLFEFEQRIDKLTTCTAERIFSTSWR